MSIRRCIEQEFSDWINNRTRIKDCVRRRSERCTHKWWDPRKWICEIVVRIKCVWKWITELIEFFFSVTKCVLCPPLSAIARFVSGSHLAADMERNEYVECAALNRTPTKVIAYAFNNAMVSTRFDYKDTGQWLRFDINGDGIVVYRTSESEQPLPIKPADYPGAREQTDTPWSVSYMRNRHGVWAQPPEFELLAANGGRIFAKEKGKFRFYFTTMEDEFFHGECDDDPGKLPPHNASTLPVHGFYAKLDPMYNKNRYWGLRSRFRDVEDDVIIGEDDLAGFFDDYGGIEWRGKNDYCKHPSLGPFSLPTGDPSLKLVKRVGIMPDVMQIMVRKKIWYQLDTRPPLSSGQPPC